MNHYDLIIIGAGPAGLSLASELKNSGLKILLLDKKKNAEDVQYNTSGSFIDPQKWNLPSYIFNPISQVYFSSKNKKAVKKVMACIIDRKKLLSYLEMEARKNKNIRIEYNSTIKEIIAENQINSLIYSKDNQDFAVSAKIFADCSGVSAVLGRKLKLAPEKPIIGVGIEYVVPLKIDSHVADLFIGSNLKGGYGWIFPKDSKNAIIGYATLSKEIFPNVEKYLKEMWKIKRVSERCDLMPIEKHVAILRTGRPLEKFVHENLLIIGDSALQVNPLVGEGIRFIMDSAKIASSRIKEALINSDLKLLENYSRDWKNKYHKKYEIAYYIQQKIKKDSMDDLKMDKGVEKIKNISDEDFSRLLSGDISNLFLVKIALKSFLVRFYNK